MKIIEPGTYEFTDAERIIIDWHNSLLDSGHSHADSIAQMLLRTPVDGPTWKVLESEDFRKYLAGTRFWGPLAKGDPEGEQKVERLLRHQCDAAGEASKNLEFTGTMGAPGVGNCYTCRVCQAPWVQVGDALFRADEQDDDMEPPWVLTIGDVR